MAQTNTTQTQIVTAKPIRKMQKNPGGRPPGSLNAVTSTAKENINAVFTQLGGVERMLAFFNCDDLMSLEELEKKADAEKWSMRERAHYLQAAIDSRAERLMMFYSKIYPRLLPVQIAGTGAKGEVVFKIEHGDENI